MSGNDWKYLAEIHVNIIVDGAKIPCFTGEGITGMQEDECGLGECVDEGLHERRCGEAEVEILVPETSMKLDCSGRYSVGI